MAAAALHRAVVRGETEAVARLVDLESAVDVLGGKTAYIAPSDERYAKNRKLIMDLIAHHCSGDDDPRGALYDHGFANTVAEEPLVNDAMLVGIGLTPFAPTAAQKAEMAGEGPAMNGASYDGED